MTTSPTSARLICVCFVLAVVSQTRSLEAQFTGFAVRGVFEEDSRVTPGLAGQSYEFMLVVDERSGFDRGDGFYAFQGTNPRLTVNGVEIEVAGGNVNQGINGNGDGAVFIAVSTADGQFTAYYNSQFDPDVIFPDGIAFLVDEETLRAQGNVGVTDEFPAEGFFRSGNQAELVAPAGIVELTPSTPVGWGGPLVVGSVAETPTSGPNFQDPRLPAGMPLFLDWRVANLGDTTAPATTIRILLNDNLLADFVLDIPPAESVGRDDFPLGPLPPGVHVVQMVIDPDGLVDEVDEGNNTTAVGLSVGDTEVSHVAQFGAGAGLGSDVVVTNRSRSGVASGSVFLFDPSGQSLDSAALLGGSSTFELAPNSSTTFRVAAPGGLDVVTGSAIISSSLPVSVVVRFSLPGTGIAGVSSSEPTSSAVVPARRSGTLETAAAVRNVGSSEAAYVFQLIDSSGAAIAESVRTVPGGGRISEFVGQIFPEIEGDFEHSMVIRSLGFRTFAAVALEFQEGEVFTTLPVGVIGGFEGNPFDLEPQTVLSFTPSETGRFDAARTMGGDLPEDLGDRLFLSDDDSREMMLQFDFPFFESTHSSVFVNANGNLTFHLEDSTFTPTEDHFRSGVPRIAPLFADFNPSAGGAVFVDSAKDRIAVTWVEVPQFAYRGNLSTFQVVLHADGQIDFVYQDLNLEFDVTNGLIGVARGSGSRQIGTIDWTGDLAGISQFRTFWEFFEPAGDLQ